MLSHGALHPVNSFGFPKVDSRLNSAQFIFNDVITCLDDFGGHHSPEDVISLALPPSLCIDRPFAPGLADAYFSICIVARDLFSLTNTLPTSRIESETFLANLTLFELSGNMCIALTPLWFRKSEKEEKAIENSKQGEGG
ncbi:hypothetical protein PAPYR_10726 [Paratrimastix pyriformis]|uniref:Uncharacterized protein n=1 Tax=Paratrimastix pyriformis TaxID=342808 RepID=A0ABQ8U5B2_9EUKA|nr:hypothetical protein PAPYR_10726 [Paratrimastix pyriformis]